MLAYWRQLTGKPRWQPNPVQAARLEKATAAYGVAFMRARVEWAAETGVEFIQMLRAADKWAKQEQQPRPPPVAALPNQRRCTRCGQPYSAPKVEAAAFAGLCADCRQGSDRYKEGKYAQFLRR